MNLEGFSSLYCLVFFDECGNYLEIGKKFFLVIFIVIFLVVKVINLWLENFIWFVDVFKGVFFKYRN